MATDIERLIVSLEASTSKYERALVKANGETNKRVRDMQRQFDGLGNKVGNVSNGISRSVGLVGRAFAAMGVGMTVGAIVSMTSAWTDLNSRVNNAAGSMERGTAVMSRLSDMARRTYSSLDQTAEAYLGNQQALSALGYSTEQQLDLVETLNNALVVGAVRGERAKSVQEAWSKAMASGSLRGDNLNTVIQSGGRLSKALADSMGVSVNELRKLGEEGKITTDKMFGVTSQMEALRIEAGNMPATVTDGFVLLRDAVTKFVGEADAAAGSSALLAEAIIAIADAINNMPDEGWFDKFFRGEADALARGWENTRKEIEAVGRAIEWLQNTKTDDFFRGLFDPSSVTEFVSASDRALGQVEDSWRRVAAEAYNATSGELQGQILGIIDGIVEESVAADEAAKKLAELASAHPEAEPFISIMRAWTDSLYAVRDGALAAADGMSAIGSMPSWRQLGKAFGPDLSSDGAPGGPIRPPSSSSGGGKSAGEKYGDSIEQFQRRIDMLKQETALTAALNPLLNDYGYAKERLKAVQELENAATRAGLSLGPEQRAQIEALADGYASATAEAARLAESQNMLRQSAEELGRAGREALDTIIDGFLEGKDAGEIFGNVLKDLGRNLLNMGLNGLFSGGGFGNILGRLFGLPGHASGTANTGGRKGEPRGIVHGQEAVIPLPSGGRVPVDIRMPAMPAAAAPGGQIQVTAAIEVINGNLVPVVTQISGQVSGQQIKSYDRQLPNRMQDIQMRQG